MTLAIAPVWIIPAWVVVSVVTGLFVGRCISYCQRSPYDDVRERRQEREAQAQIYNSDLRSFPRRTPVLHEVPKNRQRWS